MAEPAIGYACVAQGHAIESRGCPALVPEADELQALAGEPILKWGEVSPRQVYELRTVAALAEEIFQLVRAEV